MCLALEEQGVEVEVHHHEVAAPGQCEIGTKFNTPLVKLRRRAADPGVHRGERGVPRRQDRNASCPSRWSATTAPVPQVHQSVGRAGRTSSPATATRACRIALYYIGGIIKHAKALNAITNPGTNSYKRLVPGFEAPINLAYSARNRSAACRIPFVASPKGRRVEVRFPDPTANPYLAFAAMLMAGLDGVQNKIHPGDPLDKNLYDLEPEEAAKVPHPCASLDEALDALDKDREFLTRGGVFTNDVIDAYIALKYEEVPSFRTTRPSGRTRHVPLVLSVRVPMAVARSPSFGLVAHPAASP